MPKTKKASLLTKSNLVLVLLVVVLIQIGLLVTLWCQQKNTNRTYASEINSLQQQATSASNGLSYQPVTVSPSEQRIYFPQLGVYIPLTALGTSLVYSPDTAYVAGSHVVPTGPPDEAAISTATTAGAPQSQTQFNCSELVRISFGPKPDPYSPSEIPSGSVNLTNGKTLQIYASYQQNCQKEWSFTQANADAIAALFRQAQSY